jgi:hypothetical protein
VLVISIPGKKFRNAVLACVLLRKSFRDDVPARSVTKIPQVLTFVTKPNYETRSEEVILV